MFSVKSIFYRVKDNFLLKQFNYMGVTHICQYNTNKKRSAKALLLDYSTLPIDG